MMYLVGLDIAIGFVVFVGVVMVQVTRAICDVERKPR